MHTRQDQKGDAPPRNSILIIYVSNRVTLENRSILHTRYARQQRNQRSWALQNIRAANLVTKGKDSSLCLHIGIPQVRLELSHVIELLLRILSRHRWRNDDILTNLPVDRSHDTLLVARLQRVDNAQDLGRVPPSGGWVEHNQTDLLGGINDEDRSDGERNALGGQVIQVLLVDHVIEEGDLAVRVGDDGELQVGRFDFVDIIHPFSMRAEIVGALDVKTGGG